MILITEAGVFFVFHWFRISNYDVFPVSIETTILISILTMKRTKFRNFRKTKNFMKALTVLVPVVLEMRMLDEQKLWVRR